MKHFPLIKTVYLYIVTKSGKIADSCMDHFRSATVHSFKNLIYFLKIKIMNTVLCI